MNADVEVRTYQERLATLDHLEVDGRPGHFSAMQGRAVPYDEWADLGWFMERHAQNSFKRSTDGAARGLPLLLFHDSRSFPVGTSLEWEHRAGDGAGVYGTWKIGESSEAQRAAAAAFDGELTGLSVGFQPVESKWDTPADWDPDRGPDHKDKATRLESRLVEVSLTPTPAFENAGVTLVRTAVRPRARGVTEAEAWRRTVDALRR